MTATWRNFESYLKKNVLFQTTSTAQNKDAQLKIKEEAKEKYGLKESSENCSELVNVLDNLLLSIKKTHLNSFEEFHPLPDLTYFNEGGNKILKSWETLFPRRVEVKFGRKNNSFSEISQEVWDVLSTIYKEWSENETRPSTLGIEADYIITTIKKAQKEVIMKKVKSRYPKLKNQMEKWLVNYEKLDEQKKKELKEDKDEIQKNLQIINNLKNKDKFQIQSFWEKAIDFKNWPWKTIGITTIVVVIILSVVWGVKKLLGIP